MTKAGPAIESNEDPQRPAFDDPVAASYSQWVAHGWGDAAPGMSVVTSLIRTHRLLLARIDDQLRGLDITFSRYEVLVLLHFSRSGALPLTTICAQLEVHQTTTSIVVGRLEKQGFVTRVPHPTDRRSKLVQLTETGRAVVLDATKRLNTTVFTDSVFTADQIGELRALRSALLQHSRS
ncbi:MarR family transcriptional regulator [Micromonospora sp. RTGN7]|uniref:MarR family winged helix-turn-helix transcriptional regulator n=1 Tax=Micromonospora sp. RTGN7 TaxID=3016526 RepID=UPI0029FF0C28|nr:MarR family transcriptional regulator [Micromonospora sp. RTGN7]